MKPPFWKEHSLSIVVGTFLGVWIILYSISDSKKHWGGFFGNAIADWTGLLSIIILTKYFYERGSKESKKPSSRKSNSFSSWIRAHSLSLVVIITGIGWIILYVSMDSQSKWGQVIGNIVSEWTQIFCLIIFTKGLVERHSKESKR